MKIINFCDLLSPSTKLLYKGNSRYKNILGGVLSCILIIFSVSIFIYFSIEALNRTDPYTSQSKIYYTQSNHTLNTSENVLAFKLTSRDGLSFNDEETVFSIRIQQWKYINDIVVERRDLKIKKCEKDYSLNSDEFNNIYKNYDFSGFFCLEPNQTIEFKNPYGSKNFSFINVYFTTCNNRTDCKSTKSLEDLLGNYFIKFVYTDFYIDHLNYNSPLIPYIKETVFFSSYSYLKIYFNNFQSIIYDSDNGIFKSEILKFISYCSSIFTEEISYSDIKMVDTRAKILSIVKFTYSNEKKADYVKRSYIKLKNIIAEVGGFVNVLKIIFEILLTIYSHKYYYKDILSNFTIKFKMEGSQDLDSQVIIHGTENKILSNKTLKSRKTLCCKNKDMYEKVYNEVEENIKSSCFDITYLIELKNEINLLKICLIQDSNLLNDFNNLKKFIFFEDYKNDKLKKISLNENLTTVNVIESRIKNKMKELKDEWVK